MTTLHDRYATVGKRNFAAAIEYLLESDFKLVGSHRVIRMIAGAVVELHREFYPEKSRLEPGTILWATTKAGEQAKVSWGKRSEEYGTQMVLLPLVTKAEIENRMKGGSGRDPGDNQRKEFRRDTATVVRLLKSAAEQGGLLSGAEVSVLMNRSLAKVHDYVRTYEQETGEALPLKGYVLDMGSSPTHKGIICRKFEEGVSPPDIARATGHTLEAVDNYLGTYARIKVLLRKGFDAPTICHVTGKAQRTVAQYLVIAEQFHPDLLGSQHQDWLSTRRKRAEAAVHVIPVAAQKMVRQLERGGTLGTPRVEIVQPGASGEVALKGKRQRPQDSRRGSTPSRGQKKTGRKPSQARWPNSK
jgi:hypothetical protein